MDMRAERRRRRRRKRVCARVNACLRDSLVTREARLLLLLCCASRAVFGSTRCACMAAVGSRSPIYRAYRNSEKRVPAVSRLAVRKGAYLLASRKNERAFREYHCFRKILLKIRDGKYFVFIMWSFVHLRCKLKLYSVKSFDRGNPCTLSLFELIMLLEIECYKFQAILLVWVFLITLKVLCYPIWNNILWYKKWKWVQYVSDCVISKTLGLEPISMELKNMKNMIYKLFSKVAAG